MNKFLNDELILYDNNSISSGVIKNLRRKNSNEFVFFDKLDVDNIQSIYSKVKYTYQDSKLIR